MNFVYLIGTSYLKENTALNENLDDKLLKSAIKEAQEIFIRDIIGSGLYDELQSQAFSGTLTALNVELMDKYIAPCLKYYTLVESMLPLTFKFLNKSVSTRTAEFSQPIGTSELSLIEQRYRDKAEYYAERLRKYLQENSTDYPLYLNPGSGIDVIRPHNTAFMGGMYLPGSDDDCISQYIYGKE